MTKSTPTTTIFFFSWILVVATAWSLWNLLLSQTTWLIPPLPNKGNNIFFFIGVVDGCFSTTRSPIPTISAPISLPPVQAPISGSTSAGIPFTDMLSSSTMRKSESSADFSQRLIRCKTS